MESMKIYNDARVCPPEAQRQIQAGKLKGKTDINPMWRIKKLTELFGPCGMGWKTTDESFWTTPGANGEVVAWCSLKLWWFDNEIGEWSDPVFGIGGSMMVDTQKGNLTSNDEAFKMAYTDAISVACKALGFAADIYWNGDADRTKYGRNEQRDDAPMKPAIPEMAPCNCEACGKPIRDAKNSAGEVWEARNIATYTRLKFGRSLCVGCMNKEPSE